ncbi:MAG: 50S ribosomal protein L24 [Puniceicoccales bacterium]|jgi:large subunit ribosomal protein L24|nr:50S ribosomal protein L24 [Puniceicoccales bacterium]
MAGKIKVGDDVEMLSGDQKGVRGKVLRVLRGENRLVVAGVHMRKKCFKKSGLYPEGTILRFEFPVHRSNVKKIIAG